VSRRRRLERETRLRVALGERSYAIALGRGSLPRMGAEIASATGSRRAIIVSVPGVAKRYAAVLERSLRGAGLESTTLRVPDGDATKNLAQVSKLYRALLRVGADRHSALVALGGGMIGDLTGFVAATFLRGIPFVQVPTTLLAMVDASIGGKVAVNLPEGKNLVGAFHQPRLVAIDVETLASLPRRERAAGFAEVVKAAAILDAGLFRVLERHAEELLELRGPLLAVVRRACAIKAGVVARDERESGPRAWLNFGHTLGHAVEKLQSYRGVLHGEAVAMGMVFAAQRSEALAGAPPGTAERLAALLARFGLPVALPNFPRAAYLRAVGVDKKSRDGVIQYVVLRGIGSVDTLPLRASEILPGGGGGGGAAAHRGRGQR
jgi:3-dehydroquinate synthase